MSNSKSAKASNHGATQHFLHQRVTAIILIPLVLWVGFSLASMPMEYSNFVAWIKQPFVTAALVLLIAAVFYHAQLGLQVVIEDYISAQPKRDRVIIVSNIFCLLFGTVGVISVLKISFGA